MHLGSTKKEHEESPERKSIKDRDIEIKVKQAESGSEKFVNIEQGTSLK